MPDPLSRDDVNTFRSQTKIRFSQVDAAGIVFYPRYFEMLNAALEDWFSERIGVDFPTMHLKWRIGTPAANIEADFKSPAFLGQVIEIELILVQIGRSSAQMAVSFTCENRLILTGKYVIVCVDLDKLQPVAWPAAIRPAMERLLPRQPAHKDSNLGPGDEAL